MMVKEWTDLARYPRLVSIRTDPQTAARCSRPRCPTAHVSQSIVYPPPWVRYLYASPEVVMQAESGSKSASHFANANLIIRRRGDRVQCIFPFLPYLEVLKWLCRPNKVQNLHLTLQMPTSSFEDEVIECNVHCTFFTLSSQQKFFNSSFSASRRSQEVDDQ